MSDLQDGRHVHQEEYQNWRDQAHLHKGIQEGAHGDEMSFLPYNFHVKVGGTHVGGTHGLGNWLRDIEPLENSRFGLRFTWCNVEDLCYVRHV